MNDETDAVRTAVRFKDPDLPWRGTFPYDRLNAALARTDGPTLGPASTGREVYDAFFHLMRGGPGREERAAWDELRRLERRLVVDFFLYEVPPLPDDLFDAERWDLPMPVELPDLLRLIEGPPDPAALDEGEAPDLDRFPEPPPREVGLEDAFPDLELFLPETEERP